MPNRKRLGRINEHISLIGFVIVNSVFALVLLRQARIRSSYRADETDERPQVSPREHCKCAGALQKD